MPSPSFCRLCQCPLEVESATGLCATCLRTADTTRADAQPSPDPGAFPVPLSSDASSHNETAQPRGPWVDPATRSFVHAADTRTAQPNGTAPPPRLPDPPPGYDLLSRLGGGGMGEVFLAHEHYANRRVAMKFLRLAGNRALIERFLRELRALAGLDHPNIVRVFANDFLRAEPYFTMEHVAGGTLGQWVETNGPLDPRAAAKLMAAIARAVAAAHENGTLHRDLKPSNILLASDGKTATPAIHELVPKVADFGLAKQMDQDTVTVGSGPIGTPNFMPPEQISAKNGPVGPASDVYGLGATLYFLLAGKPPFGSGEPLEIMHRVLTAPVPRPRATRPEVPPDLDGIVVKCLEKETTDRYQTALALAEDLETFLEGKKTVAPPQTVVRRARRWAGRHRVGVVAAGLLVVLMAITGAIRPWEKKPPPDPYAEIERELDAGRRVDLMGKDGLPRWHKWHVSEGQLRLAVANDGSVDVTAYEQTFLELVRDPRRDSYRFKAKLRQQTTSGGDGTIGLYVGFDRITSPNKCSVYPVVLSEFSEVYTGAELEHGRLDAHGVKLMTARPIVKPDLAHTMQETHRGHLPFKPQVYEPRPWRILIFDVTPAGVQLFWATEGEPSELNPVAVGFIPAQHLALERQYVQRDLGQILGDPNPHVPDWHPRRPLGIWAFDSSFTVKDVTIEPLPLK